jgi:membrane-associated HD superfamily phosphohydrolase
LVLNSKGDVMSLSALAVNNESETAPQHEQAEKELADVMIVDKGTAERFVRHAETVMENIIELIKKESESVRQGEVHILGEIEEAKASFVKDYALVVETARIYKKQLSRFAPVAIDRLRNRHETFRAELQINMAALATAKAVSESLVKSVVKDVQKQKAPPSYGASARMDQSRSTSAIAIDRDL